MRGRRFVVALVVTAVAVAAGLATVTVPAGATGSPPTRILILGDSITQGSAGDYTWRYRLWRHLEATGEAVDFVGPRDDLFANIGQVPGSHDYVDPAFDTDHAASYGQSLTFPPYPTTTLVSDYSPDVIVEALGVNDLTWLHATPADVDELLRTLVSDARAVEPTVEVVLARLPSTNIDAVAPFNELVTATATELSTAQSQVEAAYADDGFVPSDDTWDGIHPNARGELKIAAAVGDALAELGVGTPVERPLPDVPVGPRLAPTLSATPSDTSATLSWSGSPGSTAEYVWLRDATAGDGWTRRGDSVSGTSLVVSGLTNWHQYVVMLQPVKGYWAAADDVRSNPVEVTPIPRPPGPVGSLSATLAGTTAQLAWSASEAATGYHVWSRNVTAGEAWTEQRFTTATSTIVDGLLPGRRYEFRVQPADDGVLGDWSPTASVAVPAATPPAPSGLRATLVSTGTVRLGWSPLPMATEFRIYTRDVTRGTSWRRVTYASPVTGTSAVVSGLRPGDVHAFKMRAVCVTRVGPFSAAVRLRVAAMPTS